MSPRLLPFLVLGLLGAVEAGLLAFAVFPDPDPVYRAVLIERSSGCVPREPSGTLHPGEAIPLWHGAEGTAFAQVLVCGFSTAASDGAFTLGPDARLRFRHRGPLTLDIEARPEFVVDGKPPEVTVFSGEREIAQLHFEPGRFSTQRVELPGAPDGVIDMHLRLAPPGAVRGARWPGLLIRSLHPR